MRLIIISIALSILIPGNNLAQSYMRVLNADTVSWNYLSDNQCGDCFLTATYTAVGDTSFDEFLYRKLYRKIGEYGDTELYGYLREDTVLGQMHLLSYSGECQDTPCLKNIVYNINLDVGDTLIFLEHPNRTDNYIVRSIEVIENRRIVSFGENILEFIEGVGPSREFATEVFLSGSLSELLCKYEHDKIAFQKSVWNFDTCYIPETGTNLDHIDNIELDVFPNPVSINQFFSVHPPDNHSIFYLEIHSISGKLIYTNIITGSQQIYLSEFTKSVGMFIYSLRNYENDRIRTGKLIVY